MPDHLPATLEALEELFSSTGAAHHEAYRETDGEDPEWPEWYASRLQQPLEHVLGRPFTRSEIVFLLVSADRLTTGVPSWPEAYAHFFLACR